MTAREQAYKILKNAASRNTYSNIAVDNALKSGEFSPSDAGLLTAIVMGVTERRITLDAVIDRLADDPDKIDSDTRVLLRMGIYQVTYLDRIPEYAAVNETVSLAPRRTRGFVNAVMRSYLRLKKGEGLDSVYPDRSAGEAEYLSVVCSYPVEMCEKFIEIYGFERARDVLEAYNRPPRLTLRINTLKISREGYAELLDGCGLKYDLSPRLSDAILLDNVSYSSLPGEKEGYFFIQDEASQICVEALGASAGETLIDACSCPGSKSFGSAIRMGGEGRVLSFDLHESKLSLVRDGAVRLGVDIIETAVRDGRDPDPALFEVADRVLCDVPCSGLGVIGKKPEIRYKSLEGISRLPEIQYAILENCSQYVKVGGYLVYSTCTVLPEENELNVKRFLKAHSEFSPCAFSAGGLSAATGMLSLSPDRDGCDGFFIAKMIKTGN